MRTHPITGMQLEDGIGALSDDDQARILHCAYIEQVEGKEAADAMRAKLAGKDSDNADEQNPGGDDVARGGRSRPRRNAR